VLDLPRTNGDIPALRVVARTVFVLREDSDLAEGLDAESRERATRLIRAAVLDLPVGPWEPPEEEPGAFGLLVLDGLIARHVLVGSSASLELVGPGDILRPSDESLAAAIVPTSAEWEVVVPGQVAVLGRDATMVIGHWPELIAAFSARFLRRTANQAFLMAAANFTRVEDRLLATLWHLSGTWGKVTPDGIVLPFRLTHEMLAQIVGARRPSVTLAMGALKREGRLIRRDDGFYVLTGEVPDWHERSVVAVAAEP
jgi:CRP/FNR family transcriptional regulator, cyclic AMP receptor protein